jgi:1,4-dihydroxy-2-naphthoyl-CoA synthase
VAEWQRNTFRPTTLSALSRAFGATRDDPAIGVIILTGAGEISGDGSPIA